MSSIRATKASGRKTTQRNSGGRQGTFIGILPLHLKKVGRVMLKIPDHVSHSQLEMFMRCQKQWEYRYIEKIIIPPGSALILGISYHKALEVNFLYKMKQMIDMPVEDCLECYHQTIDESESEWRGNGYPVVWENPGRETAIRQGHNLVLEYRTTVATQLMPKGVEETYQLKLGDTNFVGRIDLRLGDNQIVDHKTSKKPYNQADADKLQQASAHAFALGQELDYEFHVAIKGSRPRIQIVKTHRSNDEIIWWLSMAKATIAQMKTGVYITNPNGWWCSPAWCGYHSLCKPWMSRPTYSIPENTAEE